MKTQRWHAVGIFPVIFNPTCGGVHHIRWGLGLLNIKDFACLLLVACLQAPLEEAAVSNCHWFQKGSSGERNNYFRIIALSSVYLE